MPKIKVTGPVRVKNDETEKLSSVVEETAASSSSIAQASTIQKPVNLTIVPTDHSTTSAQSTPPVAHSAPQFHQVAPSVRPSLPLGCNQLPSLLPGDHEALSKAVLLAASQKLMDPAFLQQVVESVIRATAQAIADTPAVPTTASSSGVPSHSGTTVTSSTSLISSTVESTPEGPKKKEEEQPLSSTDVSSSVNSMLDDIPLNLCVGGPGSNTRIPIHNQKFSNCSTSKASVDPVPSSSTQSRSKVTSNLPESWDKGEAKMTLGRTELNGDHLSKDLREHMTKLIGTDVFSNPIGDEAGDEDDGSMSVGEDSASGWLHSLDERQRKKKKKDREMVQCQFCEKILRHGSMREHMDRHTGEGKFGCDMCDMKFSRCSALEKHRLTHTGEKPYCCPVCEKSYRQKVHLNEHMRSHTGERPYTCPQCHLALASKSLLNRHVRTHSSTREHACDLCEKTFKRREGLLSHMAIHEVEKKFHCDQCDRAFGTPRALKCHQVVHTDERPYSCHVCDKAFKTAKLCRSHVATHTQNRPFSCDQCDKSFRTKSYLENHRQVHNKDRYLVCHGCQRAFQHKSSLEKHMKRVHGERCGFSVAFRDQTDGAGKSTATEEAPESVEVGESEGEDVEMEEEEENSIQNIPVHIDIPVVVENTENTDQSSTKVTVTENILSDDTYIEVDIVKQEKI